MFGKNTRSIFGWIYNHFLLDYSQHEMVIMSEMINVKGYVCAYCGNNTISKGDEKCACCGTKCAWETTSVMLQENVIPLTLDVLKEQVIKIVKEKFDLHELSGGRHIGMDASVIRKHTMFDNVRPVDNVSWNTPNAVMFKEIKAEKFHDFVESRIVIFGISPPYSMYEKQERELDHAKELLKSGDPVKFVNGIRDGKWSRDGTLLEIKKNFLNGTENRSFGKPLSTPIYISKAVGFFYDPISRAIKEFTSWLGGKFNKNQVCLNCSNCGKKSVKEICPSCGTEKIGFILESLTKAMYKDAVTPGTIMESDGGYQIKWRGGIKVLNDRTPSDDDLISLVEKAAPNKLVTVDDLLNDKVSGGSWIVLDCDVAHIMHRDDNDSGRPMIVTDASSYKDLSLWIPDHIWHAHKNVLESDHRLHLLITVQLPLRLPNLPENYNRRSTKGTVIGLRVIDDGGVFNEETLF